MREFHERRANHSYIRAFPRTLETRGFMGGASRPPIVSISETEGGKKMTGINEGEFRARLEALAAREQGDDADARLWLVLEGDYGGQVYLTLPWRLVRKGARIARLLCELDQFAWRCNGGEGLDAYVVDGDCSWLGADALSDDLWLDPEFGPRHVARARKLLCLDD